MRKKVTDLACRNERLYCPPRNSQFPTCQQELQVKGTKAITQGSESNSNNITHNSGKRHSKTTEANIVKNMVAWSKNIMTVNNWF